MSVLETLPRESQQLIKEHLNLVIETNKVINLTRIDSYEEAMILHVEDSLAGLDELNEAPKGLYGDLGSGAGYPGIPLAIASNRETVLIDARKKKMDAVSGIIEKLELSHQIKTYSGRAELLAKTQSKRYAALTARALSQLPVLLELASPLLQKGGMLICYKAKLTDEEYEKAHRIKGLVGMRLVNDKSFLLEEKFKRRILTFEKYEEPQVKLPRLEGQAQKNPLQA